MTQRHVPVLIVAGFLAGCAGGGGDPLDAAQDATLDVAVESAEADPGADQIETPLLEVRVTAGGYAVRWTFATRELALLRGDDTLLRFEADGLQLGRVDALDASQSYDPWFLYPASGEGLYTPPAGLAWLSPVNGVVVTREDGTMTLDLGYDQGIRATLEVRADAEGRFRVAWKPGVDGAAVGYFRLRARADADEGFYGLGGVHDAVNHRGRTRPMQVEVDLDSESSNNDAHTCVPLLIGTRGWGLFVQDPHGGAVDVATQADDLVELTWGTGAASRDGLVFHLFGATHPLDVTRHYYAVTGAPRLPARWALGPWLWRDEGVDQAKVTADLEAIRDHDLACSGYWIDRPYASAVNSFDFLPADYADPKAMVDRAHALGFRMALWHAPYVDPKAPATKPLNEAAVAGGYFPPLIGITFAKWGPLVDFTNPAAVGWWQGLLKAYGDLGIEGYKLDYAEEVALGVFGMRTPWQFADGSDELTMHHGYQGAYHRAYGETLPPDGGFLLTRTALAGDQANGVVVWPGDLDASFQRHGEQVLKNGTPKKAVGGLFASMVYGLSLAPSGFAFYGADTGGYINVDGPPDKELFTRWMQQTALSSVMQVGNGESTVPWETGGPDGYDDEMLGWYRDFSRLHLRLWPYAWTYATALATTGRPIQRPFGLAHPETGQHPSDQYFFGDDLLVAPVLDRGVAERPVVLPAGRWLDWFDGTSREGPGTVTVAAPLSRLPLFLRAGGIVPLLRPTIDSLAPTSEPDRVDSYATTPGVLYARVAAGPASTFTVFDGATLSQELAGGVLHLGACDGTEFRQGTVFEVMGLKGRPAQVSDGGEGLAERADAAALEASPSGWRWEDDRSGVLWVKVPSGDRAVVVTW